ncbi:MAG: STAS domain-containing protein, partial [Acetobacteraceae bacterium]|nr:STAS domain-containing protein [Acetobacteraceae bacterium]
MEIQWEVRGQALVARLQGELDLHTAHVFRQGVEARIAGPVRHLVVNLEGLTFIDSSGLGGLLGRFRWLRE